MGSPLGVFEIWRAVLPSPPMSIFFVIVPPSPPMSIFFVIVPPRLWPRYSCSITNLDNSTCYPRLVTVIMDFVEKKAETVEKADEKTAKVEAEVDGIASALASTILEESNSLVVVDNEETLGQAIDYLGQFSVLSLDCEGVDLGRDGELCLIQIATQERCFLFDVYEMTKVGMITYLCNTDNNPLKYNMLPFTRILLRAKYREHYSSASPSTYS